MPDLAAPPLLLPGRAERRPRAEGTSEAPAGDDLSAALGLLPLALSGLPCRAAAPVQGPCNGMVLTYERALPNIQRALLCNISQREPLAD